jgi:hypothetical protein
MVNEHFFEQTKLSCCLTFKISKLYPDGNTFLNIYVSCSSCLRVLRGKVKNQPEEGSRVIIRCTIEGSYKECNTRKKNALLEKIKILF